MRAPHNGRGIRRQRTNVDFSGPMGNVRGLPLVRTRSRNVSSLTSEGYWRTRKFTALARVPQMSTSQRDICFNDSLYILGENKKKW